MKNGTRIFPVRPPLTKSMDSFLSPATPAQIADVYAHLHVTHRALMLTQWRVFFALLGVSLNLLLPWLLLATGLSARLRDRAGGLAARLLRFGFVARLMKRLEAWDVRRRRGCRWRRFAEWDERVDKWTRGLRAWREWDPAIFRTTVLYAGAYFLLYRVVKIPASLGAYRVEAAYGLTHQSAAAWISGRSTDWMNGIIANTLGAVLVLWLIRFSPRRGPAVLAALFAGSVFVFWWLPTPPDPTLRPLPVGALSQRLHVLADRAGMPQVQILVDETADGRDETNGYAGHSGGTPRILFTRKMLDTEPPEQVEATMGHELGHCFYRDGLTTLLLSLAGLFVALPLLRWLAGRMLARFGPRWRVTSLADPAALPVLLLSFHLITLMTDPLANAYSRAVECRADAYGIALTRNRAAAAQEYVTFCDQEGRDPNPPAWFVLWHDNHPASAQRLRLALTGQPGDVRRARGAGLWRHR